MLVLSLIEGLFENVLIPDQLGQIFNHIVLVFRGADGTSAQCHVMFDSGEGVFVADVGRTACRWRHFLAHCQLVDFDALHLFVESIAAVGPMHRIVGIYVIIVIVALKLVVDVRNLSSLPDGHL